MIKITTFNMTDHTTRLKLKELFEIPEEMWSLTDLIQLKLSYCYFTTLPESIGNLINLGQLILNTIPLETLPESICNLTKLYELYITGNHLKKLPKNIGKLKNLISLNLDKLFLIGSKIVVGKYSDFNFLVDVSNIINNKKCNTLTSPQ